MWEGLSVSDAIDYLDVEACENYLKDPWNRKHKLGLYFSAIHEISGLIYINFQVKINNNWKWFRTLHSLHDGFDALKLLSIKTGTNLVFKNYQIPKPKNKLFSIIISLMSKPREQQIIKRVNANKIGYQYEGVSFSLNLAQQPKLPSVLKILSEICSNHFLKNNTSRWMIPIRTSNDKGLQASFIGLNISPEDSVDSITKQYLYKLKSGEYWGRYYIAKAGVFLGSWIIRYATKRELEKETTQWFGSLSHLGEIQGDVKLQQLCAYAPVRYHRPIGATIYKYNDRFYLTLSIHKSLDTSLINEVIDEVKKRVSSL